MGNILEKLRKEFVAVYMRDGYYKVVCDCNGTGYIINLNSIFTCKKDKVPLTAEEIMEFEDNKTNQVSTILVACLNKYGEMNYFTSKNQKMLSEKYGKFIKIIRE